MIRPAPRQDTEDEDGIGNLDVHEDRVVSSPGEARMVPRMLTGRRCGGTSAQCDGPLDDRPGNRS
jgi:hypothetical protein